MTLTHATRKFWRARAGTHTATTFHAPVLEPVGPAIATADEATAAALLASLERIGRRSIDLDPADPVLLQWQQVADNTKQTLP